MSAYVLQRFGSTGACHEKLHDMEFTKYVDSFAILWGNRRARWRPFVYFFGSVVILAVFIGDELLFSLSLDVQGEQEQFFIVYANVTNFLSISTMCAGVAMFLSSFWSSGVKNLLIFECLEYCSPKRKAELSKSFFFFARNRGHRLGDHGSIIVF